MNRTKIAETHRAIALDFPGYGKSDKPLDPSYSFNFYNQLLTQFLAQINADKVHVVMHDLGGPIGVLWALRNQERIKSLIFLNTLVYSNFSAAVIAFTLALKMPIIREWATSPNGIARALRVGVENKDRISGELLRQYQSPFIDMSARQALIKSTTNLSIKAFKEIEAKLSSFTVPIRAIYGVNDRILPKVADTMKRIKADLPQTEITPIPNCGHFLQEDEPEIISNLISEFLNPKKIS